MAIQPVNLCTSFTLLELPIPTIVAHLLGFASISILVIKTPSNFPAWKLKTHFSRLSFRLCFHIVLKSSSWLAIWVSDFFDCHHHVIYICLNILSQHRLQDPVHKALIGCPSAMNAVFSSSLSDLIIPWKGIHEVGQSATGCAINRRIYVEQKLRILWTCIIEVNEVYAHLHWISCIFAPQASLFRPWSSDDTGNQDRCQAYWQLTMEKHQYSSIWSLWSLPPTPREVMHRAWIFYHLFPPLTLLPHVRDVFPWGQG